MREEYQGKGPSGPFVAKLYKALLRDVGTERGHHHGFAWLCAFSNGTAPTIPFASFRGVHLQERAAHGDVGRRLC